MSCSAILLVCVVLLEFGPGGGGPGGGGPGGPVPCTCLMLDETESCLKFGVWPGLGPIPIRCHAEICVATTNTNGELEPTCPLAEIRLTRATPQLEWATEVPRFVTPPLGSKGKMRTPSEKRVCTFDVYCGGCLQNNDASPPGEYCMYQNIGKDVIQLYALCLLDGADEECDGN